MHGLYGYTEGNVSGLHMYGLEHVWLMHETGWNPKAGRL